MKELRLSEKHGVNPSINVCFFCGKDKEIVLLGKLKGDIEAPRRMMMDYEPCDDCKSKFGDSTILIEVTETQDHAVPPVCDGAWPTGRWCVIAPELSAKLFGKAVPRAALSVEQFSILVDMASNREI